MSALRALGCSILLVVRLFGVESGQAFSVSQAIPVQLSATTNDGINQLLTNSLIFLPPDGRLYFAKQLWTDSSRITYASLQLYLYYSGSGSDPSSVTLSNVFVTRGAVIQPYSQAQPFDMFAAESRLFMVRCCGCGNNGIARVSFYWPQDAGQSFLTASTDTSNTLRLSTDATTGKVPCDLSSLKITEYPITFTRAARINAAPPEPTIPTRPTSNTGQTFPTAPTPTGSAGAAGPSGQKGDTGTGASRNNTGPIRVKIIANFGGDKAVVGVRRLSANSYALVALPYSLAACQGATVFSYQEFDESHVAPDGSITSRASFTLLHEATGLYVVADVSDTTALNVGSNLTGLGLKNATEFYSATPDSPDYRFFVQYEGLDFKFLGYNSIPGNISYLGNFVTIICPLYHRRYCIVPTNSGKLKVAPVTLIDQNPYPTLVDPISGFAEFLRRLNSSGPIPTFSFMPIDNYTITY